MLDNKELFPEIDLFGKTIKLKGFYCPTEKRKICKYDCKDKAQIGLYINVNNICNADCKFCNIHNLQSANLLFDLVKFEDIFKELVEREILNRVAITGGEPFLSFDIINQILNIIYKYTNNLIVTINTNATYIDKIKELNHLDKILGVNISRHHYDDKLNDEIFSCKTATKEKLIEISKSVPSNILRLKCNLVKGYIDNIDEMKKYLEFASDIGAYTVGFVTLREENEFCVNNKVEIKDFGQDKDILHISSNYDRDYCQCNNYVYRSKDLKFIEIFDRYIQKKNDDYCFQLVYSNNELLTGFGKEKII